MGTGPHPFCGILGAREWLPCAIAFILSSSSTGKNSSLAMGLFQGDSHGNGEWEAALSTCVRRVTAAAHPEWRLCGPLPEPSLHLVALRLGVWAGEGPVPLPCPLPVSVAPSTRAPKAVSYETQAGSQGHPGLALAQSSFLSIGSWRQLPQVLLVRPLCFEPVNRSLPKYVHVPLRFLRGPHSFIHLLLYLQISFLTSSMRECWHGLYNLSEPHFSHLINGNMGACPACLTDGR